MERDLCYHRAAFRGLPGVKHPIHQLKGFVMIRPGKITCAGLVAIIMVLPNSLWKGSSARASVRVITVPNRPFSRVNAVRETDRRR